MDAIAEVDSGSSAVTIVEADVTSSPQPGIGGSMSRHPIVVALVLALLSTAAYIHLMHYTTGYDTIPNELLPIVMLNGHGFDFTEIYPHNAPLPYYFERINNR